MALRTLLLISLASLAAAATTASPVRRYALDDRAVYAVRIAPDAPTTITFPGPITAIEGAGVSTKPEDQPPVLISHHAESAFFSVRALRPDASGAANVVYRGRLFAFTFTAGNDPYRALTFSEETPSVASALTPRPTIARLLSLLDRAKHHAALVAQYPVLTQAIATAAPNTTVVTGPVAFTVEAVFGFADENAVVLRLRLENRGSMAVHYAPARLTIQVGGANFPSALNDASGELGPNAAASVHVVLVGNPDGVRAPLSVNNTFVPSIPFRE